MIEEIDADPLGKIFKNISNLIDKLGKLILKNIDQGSSTNEGSDDFQVNLIDNYDFYDTNMKYCCRKNVIEPYSTDDLIYQEECTTAYRRAFKFLQLLCENGNTESKIYIREQPGKMDSINFINTATTQIRNLFVVMCKQIVDVP